MKRERQLEPNSLHTIISRKLARLTSVYVRRERTRGALYWNYQAHDDAFLKRFAFIFFPRRSDLYARSLKRPSRGYSRRQMLYRIHKIFFDASPIAFRRNFRLLAYSFFFPLGEGNGNTLGFIRARSGVLKSSLREKRIGKERGRREKRVSPRYLHLGRRFYSRLARFRRKQCASNDLAEKETEREEREREKENVKKSWNKATGLTPSVFFSLGDASSLILSIRCSTTVSFGVESRSTCT